MPPVEHGRSTDRSDSDLGAGFGPGGGSPVRSYRLLKRIGLLTRWPDGGLDQRQIGDDPGLRVWDVATGKPLRLFKCPPRGGHAVAYLPDGRSIVTAGDDGTALVWDVSDLADRRPPDLSDIKALEAFWADLASDDAPRRTGPHGR